MPFDEAMNIMLPPRNGTTPHITSVYGMRADRMHEGVDFNYVGGQNGINLQHPTVYSPVNGTVIQNGPGATQHNAVRIRADDGSIHEIFHLHDHAAGTNIGQRITVGQQIGTMGNRGLGSTGAHHVHYQVRQAQPDPGFPPTIDPVRDYWIALSPEPSRPTPPQPEPPPQSP